MREYLSVAALYIRTNLWKLLLLIFAVSVGQTAYFTVHYQSYLAYAKTQLPSGEGATPWEMERLEDMFAPPYLMIAGAAFLLLCAALCAVGCARASKTGYTLARLGITEREVFWVQATVNALFLVIFWSIQVLLSVWMCTYYCANVPFSIGGVPVVSGQSILLAFYRDSFLHALLPMSDPLGWSCLVLLLLALSVGCAGFSFLQRRGIYSSYIITTALVTLAYFGLAEGELGVILVYLDAVIVILHIIYKVYTVDAALEEEASWKTEGGAANENG